MTEISFHWPCLCWDKTRLRNVILLPPFWWTCMVLDPARISIAHLSTFGLNQNSGMARIGVLFQTWRGVIFLCTTVVCASVYRLLGVLSHKVFDMFADIYSEKAKNVKAVWTEQILHESPTIGRFVGEKDFICYMYSKKAKTIVKLTQVRETERKTISIRSLDPPLKVSPAATKQWLCKESVCSPSLSIRSIVGSHGILRANHPETFHWQFFDRYKEA
jgi:hypothetical protein